MLSDIVVDTDVFAHAENPTVDTYDDSREFIETLRGVQTSLCFDNVFNTDTAKNKSQIASEYFERLPAGSIALVLIAECAAADRISVVGRKVRPEQARAIRELVRDKSDHKFIRTAINSQEKLVVSHDGHILKRASDIADRLDVSAVRAGACLARLAN
jgi:predicted nucleic acid-binding protein